MSTKPGTMQERAYIAAWDLWMLKASAAGVPVEDIEQSLIAFAAAEVAEAVRVEREACAAWFADMGSLPGPNVAAAIRARSKT